MCSYSNEAPEKIGNFTVGEWVLSPRGWGKIEKANNASRSPYPIEHLSHHYTEDGRYASTDKYPSLLTVEQAAKLGHYPPKKMKKVTVWVEPGFAYRNGRLGEDGGAVCYMYGYKRPNTYPIEIEVEEK